MSKFNNKTLKFIFIHLKIVFEYSKNTKYEKNMVNELFERICINTKIKQRFRYLNEEYKFFNDIINMLLSNEFITIKNKKYLKIIKNIIEKNRNHKYRYEKEKNSKRLKNEWL